MTRLDRLIKRAISSWLSHVALWKLEAAKKRVDRLLPEIQEFTKAEKKGQRAHGKVKVVQKARRDYMTSALRGEVR
jgi:hypothetical protein